MNVTALLKQPWSQMFCSKQNIEEVSSMNRTECKRFAL